MISPPEIIRPSGRWVTQCPESLLHLVRPRSGSVPLPRLSQSWDLHLEFTLSPQPSRLDPVQDAVETADIECDSGLLADHGLGPEGDAEAAEGHHLEIVRAVTEHHCLPG